MPLSAVKSDKSGHVPELLVFTSLPQALGKHPINHLSPSISYTNSSYGIGGFSFAAVAMATLLLLSLVSFTLWQYHPTIAKENGLLESAQSALLVLACVVATLRFWRIRTSGSLYKDLLLGLLLLCLAILLREVDIDKLGSSPLWPLLEKVCRTIVAVLLLGFIFSLRQKIKGILHNFAALLSTRFCLLVMAGLLLYICSWPLDKNLLTINYSLSQLFEEMLELDGCLLFVFAACSRE